MSSATAPRQSSTDASSWHLLRVRCLHGLTVGMRLASAMARTSATQALPLSKMPRRPNKVQDKHRREPRLPSRESQGVGLAKALRVFQRTIAWLLGCSFRTVREFNRKRAVAHLLRLHEVARPNASRLEGPLWAADSSLGLWSWSYALQRLPEAKTERRLRLHLVASRGRCISSRSLAKFFRCSCP